MGLEPTNGGTTIHCLNLLATPAMCWTPYVWRFAIIASRFGMARAIAKKFEKSSIASPISPTLKPTGAIGLHGTSGVFDGIVRQQQSRQVRQRTQRLDIGNFVTAEKQRRQPR